MQLGEYIENIIEEQGRTKKWVADSIDINYKTFVDRIKNDRLTGNDLVRIGKLLNVDLNELKEMGGK